MWFGWGSHIPLSCKGNNRKIKGGNLYYKIQQNTLMSRCERGSCANSGQANPPVSRFSTARIPIFLLGHSNNYFFPTGPGQIGWEKTNLHDVGVSDFQR